MVSFVVAAMFVAVAATVSAQVDEEAIDELICSEDISTRASVLQCLALIPKSHFEIIKQCNPEVATLGNDPFKLLNYYCKADKDFSESDKCIAQTYRKKGMSEMEPVRPSVDCLQKMIQGKK